MPERWSSIRTLKLLGVGHSSDGRVLCWKGLDPPAWRIIPVLWMPLQFGLFSILMTGPQLVHQGLWCYPVCGKVLIKDLLLLIGKSSLCGDTRCPPKKYVTMTICLVFISLAIGHRCALEASLNKTNFLFSKITWRIDEVVREVDVGVSVEFRYGGRM